MSTLTHIEKHLEVRATAAPHRRGEESPHTEGYPLTLIDWDELNEAIDQLCAQFKAAQKAAQSVPAADQAVRAHRT